MDMLKVLAAQNRCLIRFLNESEDFLEQANAGNLSGLVEFQNQRETIIQGFKLFDKEISQFASDIKEDEKTIELVDGIRAALAEKEKTIQAILATDEKIIEHIENEKLKLQRESSESEKQNQLFKKYRSKWMNEAGEKLDGKV